jgi:hypothetical protein
MQRHAVTSNIAKTGFICDCGSASNTNSMCLSLDIERKGNKVDVDKYEAAKNKSTSTVQMLERSLVNSH